MITIIEQGAIAVYPRWRGEHSGRAGLVSGDVGLSPLARGTPQILLLNWRLPRFIPAGAGNTPVFCCSMCRCPVYPRWRGEHVYIFNILIIQDGLSPLARGTLRAAREAHQDKRFIPAGAGNTASKSILRCLRTVYPRWRGEHWLDLSSVIKSPGLSPLARGTQQWRALPALQIRFIPAGAGNTPERPPVYLVQAVYPRWRGEHHLETVLKHYRFGLSPLARGTRQAAPH